jgi:hypothetical protein
MAAIRGTVSGSRGEASRLGSKKLKTTNNTWKTYTTTHMADDGSFSVELKRGRRGLTIVGNPEADGKDDKAGPLVVRIMGDHFLADEVTQKITEARAALRAAMSGGTGALAACDAALVAALGILIGAEEVAS